MPKASPNHTKNIPKSCKNHVYTLYIPCIYPVYTLYIPCIYPVYTLYIPCIYLVYTRSGRSFFLHTPVDDPEFFTKFWFHMYQLACKLWWTSEYLLESYGRKRVWPFFSGQLLTGPTIRKPR